MKISSSEIKKKMSKLEEEIGELEEKLDSEKDIDMFELNCYRIEVHRDALQKLAIKKEENDW